MKHTKLLFMGLAFFCSLLCWVKWSAADPKQVTPPVLRAQRMEIVDETGRVRAVLGYEKGVGTHLKIFRETGETAVEAGIDAGETLGVSLFAKNGLTSAKLSTNDKVGLFFTLNDPLSTYCVAQIVLAGGSARLSLNQEKPEGKVIGSFFEVYLPHGDSEKPRLRLFDNDYHDITLVPTKKHTYPLKQFGK